MGIKEKRINKLIELFNEKETLLVDEIKNELGINERSMKGYISELRELGFDIKAENKRYRVIKAKPLAGSILGKQEFRMIHIINVVGKSKWGLDRKTLVDSIYGTLCDDANICRKTIERSIKACEESGYIVLDENNKYRLSIDTTMLYRIKEDDVFRFLELCEIHKENMPHYKEVNDLRSKIISSIDNIDVNYNINCVGRKYEESSNSRDIIKSFEKLNFRNKTLLIKFNSKIGQISENVQVVSLLYSWEKDKTYVVGLVQDKVYLIDVKTIYDMEETEEDNKHYNDKATIAKLDLMFGASLDGPYDVEVEFENIFNIKEKIYRLHKHRSKSSSIIERDNKLVYKDCIYGLYDFANYIRRFGAACRVKEPQELKDIMKRTYEKMLLNYGECGNE